MARFVKLYNINADEAEKSLKQYESLNEFFTRRLQEGARPIDPSADTLISPVDALITGIGTIEDGTIVNVKGQDYTVEELLSRSPRTENYRDGRYMVLYLSPTDYHRIHAPAAGRIVEREHVEGRVYPVNDFGMRHMRTVLSRNERLITYIRHEQGEIAVVKVGAMNVSSIRYTEPLKDSVSKGEELAYFEFGSTVVLLTQRGMFLPRADLKEGVKIRMGEALGKLNAKQPSASPSAK